MPKIEELRADTLLNRVPVLNHSKIFMEHHAHKPVLCEVKGDVYEILWQSISEVLDLNRNCSVLASQHRLDELSRMGELLRLVTVLESNTFVVMDI